MLIVSIVAALTMAVVLLWAALEKVRSLPSMAATVQALGVPRATALPAALAVTAAETGVAVALLFRPDSAVTQAAMVSLAGLFALAGTIALLRDEPIPCRCFGTGGRHLGAPQIIAFLPWLAGVGVVRRGFAEAPPASVAAASFAAIALSLAAIKGAGVWRGRNEARTDRRSAEEMYEWLPSR